MPQNFVHKTYKDIHDYHLFQSFMYLAFVSFIFFAWKINCLLQEIVSVAIFIRHKISNFHWDTYVL